MNILITIACLVLLFLATGIRIERHHGQRRVIYFGYGRCNEVLHEGEPGQHLHEEWCRLYPVKLRCGTLGQSGDKLCRIWMCPHHAASWLGHHPYTGQKYAWGMPVEENKEQHAKQMS